MQNTVYTPQQIAGILSPVFAAHHIRSAVLFGSYAKGSADAQSDVDILVDSGLRGMAFFGLLEDVVDALKKPVDLLDTTQITQDSEVDREISRDGVLIYEQQRQAGT